MRWPVTGPSSPAWTMRKSQLQFQGHGTGIRETWKAWWPGEAGLGTLGTHEQITGWIVSCTGRRGTAVVSECGWPTSCTGQRRDTAAASQWWRSCCHHWNLGHAEPRGGRCNEGQWGCLWGVPLLMRCIGQCLFISVFGPWSFLETIVHHSCTYLTSLVSLCCVPLDSVLISLWTHIDIIVPWSRWLHADFLLTLLYPDSIDFAGNKYLKCCICSWYLGNDKGAWNKHVEPHLCCVCGLSQDMTPLIHWGEGAAFR